MNAPDRSITRENQVGAGTVRVEDQRFLTGTGYFTDDVKIKDMLHAAVLRSPHANAKLVSLNTEGARALPGVVAVYTAKDFPSPLPLIPIRLAPMPGLDRYLQPPIATDRVRYVGEPLAVVIAISRYVAEDALEIIEAEYETLDPVTSISQILNPIGECSERVHELVGTNIGSHYHVSRGDVDSGFAIAEYTRKERFRCHRHTASPMETRGLVAEYDGSILRIHGATKVPFFNRRLLGDMLSLPVTAIDMVETDIGGGFGVRGEFYPEDYLVPWASIQLMRPVKWIEDRREHLIATNHARETECELEIGLMRDGTIVGLRAMVMADLGAYARTGGGVALARIPQFLPGPYRIKNFACEVFACFTNKTPVGTYRGPGRYEANFFRERLIDMAANDLGIDPIDIRNMNLVSASEIPYDIGTLVPWEQSNEYDGGDFHSAFRQALEAIKYPDLLKDGALKDGRMHGVGVACFTESSGAGPSESARIVACPDGSYQIFSGVTTMGQGHETVFAQIASDELGLPISVFRVFHGSTAYVDEGWGTFHSRAIVVGGSAVKMAAESMRELQLDLAARRTGLARESLRLSGGYVLNREDGSTVLDIAQLATEAMGGDIDAREATHIKARFDIKMRTYSYGSHVAHVAVDPKTAKVEVLSYVALEDVGRVINPLLALGQAVGGAVQGIGATFLDELIYDETGQLLTGSLADYLMPTSTDAPPVIAIMLEEAPSISNPLGAKGAGEGGIVASGAALANAVANALKPLNVHVHELPLSLDKLSRSIRVAKTRI